MKEVLPKKGTKEEFDQISTVNHITEKFPPCYIMTSNEDFLREQPEPLKKVLDEKKVPYRYKLYGDDSNPLGHVFHLDMRNETGKLCNDDECEYFKKFL